MNPFSLSLAYPSFVLSSLIHHYEWMDIQAADPAQKIVNHASFSTGFVFLFYRGKQLMVHSSQTIHTPLSTCGLISPTTQLTLDSQIEHVSIFRIIFQPGALFATYGIPMSEVKNQVINIGYAFDAAITSLYEEMLEIPYLDRCVHVFETYLFRKVRDDRKPLLFQKTSTAIAQSDHPINANELADNLATSRRNLNRMMAQELGISSKEFLQTYRFCEVLHHLNQGCKETLTQVGLRFGYFDQAHFVREFKHEIGCTPGQYKLMFRNLFEMKPLEESLVGWKLLEPTMSHLYNFA